MPSKNIIRNFVEGGIYHVFNRGVEKRDIFVDKQDYNIFLYYIFIYLKPLEDILQKYPKLPLRLHSKNLNSQIKLFSYCLMPNHFHFLLKQNTVNGASKFIKQIINAYTLYFNKKYNRVGALMQGRFKAVMIENDDLLLHVSRYIHLNPIIDNLVNNLEDYKLSSCNEYFKNYEGLCNKDLILEHFKSNEEYKKFILDHVDYAKELNKIKHLVLE